MIDKRRSALQKMWKDLRTALEYDNGNHHFSILIKYDEGGKEKQYIMNMVAVVKDNKIVEVYNAYKSEEFSCILISFKSLVSSELQYSKDCTEPSLPPKGNRDFLTEIKLQLMFGLSDLETAMYARNHSENKNKAVNIFNLAHIGESMLTPYKLVAKGEMTYSKYGFRPINWLEAEYEKFLQRLSTVTLNDLSDNLKGEIKTFVGKNKINSSTKVRDIIRDIPLDEDDDTLSDLCEKIMKEVLQLLMNEDENIDSDLEIIDPNDSDYSIYYQSTTESSQYNDADNLKHKYVVVDYKLDDEVSNNNGKNNNNNSNNNKNESNKNNDNDNNKIDLQPLYNLNNNENNLYNNKKRGRNNNYNNYNTYKRTKKNGGKRRNATRRRRSK
jgi:hypothetical protein